MGRQRASEWRNSVLVLIVTIPNDRKINSVVSEVLGCITERVSRSLDQIITP